MLSKCKLYQVLLLINFFCRAHGKKLVLIIKDKCQASSTVDSIKLGKVLFFHGGFAWYCHRILGRGDGLVIDSGGSGACGGVVRDHEGMFFVGFSCFMFY